MKPRWSVGVIAVLAVVVVVAVCLAQAQNGLDQPGTRAGDTATGPDGGVYVWVPAGEFMMGSEDEPLAKPVHRVRLTRGFWLERCDVTLGQWKAYCRKVGAQVGKATAPGDDHPVAHVNWDEASAYCRAYALELPTEAQWEYAARGPEARRFPWGNQADKSKCCNSENTGPGGLTYPAGSFPDGASWCGALDMAGEVWQWCKDWYDGNYYATSPTDDPPGPDRGETTTIPGLATGEYRVLRGSSFTNDVGHCGSAGRGDMLPVYRLGDGGFRCVKTP